MEYHNLQTPQPQQPQWGYGWAPPPPAQPPTTHTNDYNTKNLTNDYNSKTHSNDYNNKSHSNDYNNSKSHSSDYNNKSHSNDYNSKTHSNKRAHSDSDDDAFSDDHSSKDATSTGGESCHLLTRKRRRGVIEKKRRDRINTSLTELKRLVPAACEKQGSAKLEKAEILQLTVDHLKMLHAKGLDTFAYDPQRYAMDYHSIGFRECAAEVARYLVSCEGLDIQDPLRLRLMSHLQCFAAQRELAAKSANWGYPQYPSTPQHGYSEIRQDPATSTATTTIAAPTAIAAPLSAAPSYSHYPPAPPAPPGPHPAPPVPHYPAPYPHHPTHHQYSQNSSKPYRPWGAELAY